MTAPQVSVLMAARNASETIGAALRSLQRQTLADWECLVIDDASTDASAECAQGFAEQDPRIRVFATQPGAQGVIAARNLGANAARGRAVAILDADDLAHRQRLQLQWEQLQRQGGGVVSCWPRYFPRAKLAEGFLRYEAWLQRQTCGAELLRSRYIEMPYVHSSLMLERALGDRLAWYRDQAGPEDYEFCLRLAASGANHAVVARRLVASRIREHSASRTESRYSLASFMTCRAEALARDYLAAQEPWILWGHGATGKALRLEFAGLGHRPEQILEVDPRKIGQSVDGIPVRDAQRWLQQPTKARLIVSVAGSNARQTIRKALTSIARIEGEGFVFAA